MTNLNLTANGKPQELILAYLQENVSDVLAEKINNGVYIEKDGKRLLSKKDLDGFMRFASDEAKKLAEKNARSACVEDNIVYGWAIHYFEENSIEGTLYNTDGTEYKPVAKTAPKVEVKKVEKPKPTTRQASLFDMIADTENKVTDQTDDHEPVDNADDEDDGEELNEDYTPEELEVLADEDSPTIEEIADKLQQALDEKNGVKREAEKPKQELPIFFVQYMDMKENHPDEIVLIRLGDFYEALDNDATILADELNLTLTGRAITADMRVPLVGFPYHAADAYIAKIRANHDVVIIESNGDIATLGKIVKTDGKTVDTSTGEILDDEAMDEPYSPSSFDKETCTVRYQNQDIIICPFRLLEYNQIFIDCLHLLTMHEPGNELYLIPEVQIPGGHVDYFLVSAKDKKIKDFIGIELQTMDTTGTVWPERQKFLQEVGLISPSHLPAADKSFGMNWKMTLKTILVQMHHKSETFEHINKHLVLIIQKPLFEHMIRNFNFSHIEGVRLGDPVHIHSYSFLETDEKLKLSLDTRISTDSVGIANCLGLNADRKVELEDLIHILEPKLIESNRLKITMPT